MSNFDVAVHYLRHMLSGIEFYGLRPAKTGKLASDDTVDPDPLSGITAPNRIWVRIENNRSAVQALIGRNVRNDVADVNVMVGYNRNSELIAIGIDVTEDMVAQWGDYTSELGAVQVTPSTNNTVTPFRLVTGARLLPPQDHVGLYVFLEAYLPLGWLGGDVLVSSGVPPVSGEFGFTAVYLNEDGTTGIYVHTPEVKPDMTSLSFDAADIMLHLPAGVYPCGVVSLYYGQTSVTSTNSRYEDLRLEIGNTTLGEWIIDYTAVVPVTLSMGVPRGFRVTDDGSFTVNGSVYVV